VLLGQSLILRQVRNGVELPPVDQNLFYDFDYQVTNHITPRVVLPVSALWSCQQNYGIYVNKHRQWRQGAKVSYPIPFTMMKCLVAKIEIL